MNEAQPQTPVPELLRLARTIGGRPDAALDRLLRLLCEQTGFEHAFVGRLDGDVRVVEASVSLDGPPLPAVGATRALTDAVCGVVVQRGTLMLPDVTVDPVVRVLPAVAETGIGSYLGTALRDPQGTVVGTLCAYSAAPHSTLNDRDTAVVQGLAEVVTSWLAALQAPVLPEPLPLPRRAHASPLEKLSRPLLDALSEVTGLASVYLTEVREEAGLQEIRFSRNDVEGFALPEGLLVPWADTLCKRALDEGRPCVSAVPEEWGDSEAGAALGIVTYVSMPVRLADGSVWGTLCAADPTARPDAEAYLPTLTVFADLIGAEVDRNRTDRDRERQLALARRQAETDELTGCANRRGVVPWIDAELALCGSGEQVLVCFVDLDGFKTVNDRFGHSAGDEVLRGLGLRLRDASRPGDLVARLGGDEFVVVMRLPVAGVEGAVQRVQEAVGVDQHLPDGAVVPVRGAVGHACASEASLGGGQALLAAADRSMYERKRRGRAAVPEQGAGA